MLIEYLKKPRRNNWYKKLPKSSEYPRHWIILEDITIELSDGYLLEIPKGFIWDGASVPIWLHWLFPAFDNAFIGDLIHDVLWIFKHKQLKHFNYNIFQARKFSDEERLKWRRAHEITKREKIFTTISHRIIRLIGGFFYSRQLQIPN